VAAEAVQWLHGRAIRCTIIGLRDASGHIDEKQPIVRRLASMDELHLLRVIDQLPDAYALFDANEHLVFFNQRYADYVPKIGAPHRTGDSFEMLLRDHVRHGVIQDAIVQQEAWIARRLQAFRSPDNQCFDVSYRDRILEARHIKTNDGGTLLILTDVTKARTAESTVSTYADLQQ
ncbi:MAG: hypothetical protein HC871_13135, partial [Rhizobiales bacterium]|nr:hypothetical protein [Hyphomicrobiales bacterium]